MLVNTAGCVLVQAECNPDNHDGSALFGYFESLPSVEDVQALFGDHDAVWGGGTCLGWAEVVVSVVEFPNVLSERSGLRRVLVGYEG